MVRVTANARRPRKIITLAALLIAAIVGSAAVASAQVRSGDNRGDNRGDDRRDDNHGDRGNDRGRDRDSFFIPGNLVVSRSVYTNNSSFPAYPFVWNTVLTDPSFGITSKIFLDQMTPFGEVVGSLEVPNSTQRGVTSRSNQAVTSFSSKSEMALNLSTDGRFLTLMGYLAPVDAVDVSNSNTPLAFDPTDPVTTTAYRLVIQVGHDGRFRFTKTNAYSGNNGRAAILINTDDAHSYVTVGNAGNGSNPQPDAIVIGAGAQIMNAEHAREVRQTPGDPTPLGSFSVTQLGAKADKVGKDDNFRGLTIFNNVVYMTKGSGSNGVNTVYFVDTFGGACPKGVGVPHPGANLPVGPITYDSTKLQTSGLPSNMCILSGFASTLNSALKPKTTAYPFGIWFADATTLYLADEGDGDIGDAGLTPAGLQKWVFDAVSASWVHVYTLQTGLGLGSTYPFPGDKAYPTGVNAATGLAWAPVVDGLRNITGRVNKDGTVTVWGITSTVSGNGDTGADPNKLVAITDRLANTNPTVALNEKFVTVRTAAFGEVLRGVSLAPRADKYDDRYR